MNKKEQVISRIAANSRAMPTTWRVATLVLILSFLTANSLFAGYIWMLNQYGHLWKTEGTSGASTYIAYVDYSQFSTCRGLAYGGGYAWALGGNLKIAKIDPTTGSVNYNFATFSSGTAGAGLTFGNGYLWAISVGGQVHRFDPVTGAETAMWTFGGYTFSGLGYADGYLWAMESAALGIYRIDISSGTIQYSRSLTDYSEGVGVGDGCFWIASGSPPVFRKYEYSGSSQFLFSSPSVDWSYAVDYQETRVFTVESLVGTTTEPVAGIYTNDRNASLTNSAVSPFLQGATQYVCIGWSMSGNEPTAGTTTNFTMILTNDCTLTWLWNISPGAPVLLSPTNLPPGNDFATYGRTLNPRPRLIWSVPLDAESNTLHFKVYYDQTAASTLVANSSNSQAGFEFYNGTTWAAFPSGGVPSTNTGFKVRFEPQSDLANNTNTNWRVVANDGTVDGASSATNRFWVGGRTWTDATLAPGGWIRVAHITELREEANYARACRSLATNAWTDPELTANATAIRAVHLTDLREVVAGLTNVTGETLAPWADDPIVPNVTAIQTNHVLELRQALETVN